MTQHMYRFGRRMRIPSTIEIKQAYLARCMLETHRLEWAAEEGMPASASWDAIIEVRSQRIAARRGSKAEAEKA